MRVVWILLSWVIVAFGQPAWVAWLAPLAACFGYAMFWRVAAEIPFSKGRFWLATAWFASAQMIQLSWMTTTEFQGLYILAVYVALAFALGLQFGLVTLFIDKIPLVATAAIWTLMEWARLHFLCGFSWNPTGLSLTAYPLSLQAASLFGIFGLSFIVFLTNLAFWKEKKVVGTLLALFPYAFGAWQMGHHSPQIEKSATLTVGLVQTGLTPAEKIVIRGREGEFISPYEQWRRIVELVHRTQEPLDLVVLPELAVPVTATQAYYHGSIVDHILSDVFGPGEARSVEHAVKVSNEYWLKALSQASHADVIAGFETEEKGRHYTSAVFADRLHSQTELYHKQVLVPLAEYIPFNWLKQFTEDYGITDFFAHGSDAKIFQSKVPLSASICYEETFPHLIRKNRLNGAALFVNLTNDNWYMHSKLSQQHFDHAKVRAVENGVPLVRACNTGVTAAVDSLGRVLGQIVEERRADLLVAHIPLHTYRTLYTLWGDWGIVTLSLLFIVICTYTTRKTVL